MMKIPNELTRAGNRCENVHRPCGEKIPGALNGYIYQLETQAVRPQEHFTPRIIPIHHDASIPLEDSQTTNKVKAIIQISAVSGCQIQPQQIIIS